MQRPPKTLLLTGASGFLGRRLSAGLSGAWDVVPSGRAAEGPGRLDLEDAGSIRRAFETVRPAIVVHAGGMALPDDCQRQPDRARRVNVEATRVLAGLCAEAGARLVFFSSDLVFDGEKGRYDEEDEARPISVYGRTKLDAEEAVLSRAPGSIVLRVSSVYGRPLGSRDCFVDELRRALSRGEATSAFVDQWRSPTAGDQLPELVLRALADPDLEGVFHWGGAERVSRYETALALCRALGFDEKLVRPGRAADKRFIAPRPCDTSLDSSRLSAALGLAPLTLAEGFALLAGID